MMTAETLTESGGEYEYPASFLPRASASSPGRSRLDSKVLDLEMDRSLQRLAACRVTAEAASQVVAILADAGSRLQRCSCQKTAAPAGCLKQEEDAVAAAAQSFLDACGGLGAMLIGMASAISQNIMQPMETFQRHAGADHNRKADRLEELRLKELSCSNAITESLQKRDRARMGLQTAMRDQEKTERKAGEKKKGLARFTRSDGEKEIAAAEHKVQKAATAQTASIEELAVRTEEANEARVLREKASKDASLLLSCIDFVRGRLLARCLRSCAVAWAEAAQELRRSEDQMQKQASKLRSIRLQGELPELPGWALEVLQVKKRPVCLADLDANVDVTDEELPESPFTAPSPSLKSPLSSGPALADLLSERGLKPRRGSAPAMFTAWPSQEPSSPFE